MNALWTPQQQQYAEDELYRWWMDTAEADFYQTVPKTREYGSHDLTLIGESLSHLAGISTPVATEMGVWLYELGKIARLEADYKADRPGKADTWFDITVYSMIARRIQYVGAWPGEGQHENPEPTE